MSKFYSSNIEIPVTIYSENDPKLMFTSPETAALMKGNIYLNTNVTDLSATSIIYQLKFLNNLKSAPTINLWINSGGGAVSSCFSILNTMELINKPIRTINMGVAYSSAAEILSHGTKGERYLYPSSKTLIHCISYGIYGKEHEMEEYKNLVNTYSQEFAERLSKITGKTVEFLKQFMREDKYLSAKEAIKIGLADKILNKRSFKQIMEK